MKILSIILLCTAVIACSDDKPVENPLNKYAGLYTTTSTVNEMSTDSASVNCLNNDYLKHDKESNIITYEIKVLVFSKNGTITTLNPEQPLETLGQFSSDLKFSFSEAYKGLSNDGLGFNIKLKDNLLTFEAFELYSDSVLASDSLVKISPDQLNEFQSKLDLACNK